MMGFNAKLKQQHEWGWLLAIWLFLGGTGSALFLLHALFNLPLAYAALALAIVIVGAAVLLYELGVPGRAWRGVSRVRTSWLSRGALSVMLFVAAGALYLAPHLPALSWLPWAEHHGFAVFLKWAAAACTVIISLYPGMFLSRNRSVPFWNSPWLIVLLAATSVQSAAAIVLTGAAPEAAALSWLPILVAANLVIAFGYLWAMARGTRAAAESVRLLMVAPLAWPFWLAAVLVGMAVPLALLVFLPQFGVLAAVFLLIGAFAFRYCLLKAGVYVPSTAAQEGIDFSKLTRRNATPLAQEYAQAQRAAARGS